MSGTLHPPSADIAAATELSEQAILSEERVLAHEGWGALVALLESATPDIDEAALVRSVRQRIARRRAGGRPLLLALAASLLLAMGISWGLTARWSRAVRHAEDLAATGSAGIAAVDVQWRDELDVELATAQRQFRGVEQRWLSLPDPVAVVRERADALEWDLDCSPL